MAEKMWAHLTHHPALMFSVIPDAFQDGVLPFDSRRGTAGHHIKTIAFQKPNPPGRVTPVLHAQQVGHVCVQQEEHLLVPATAPVVMAKLNISGEGTAYLAILVLIHGGSRNLISGIMR